MLTHPHLDGLSLSIFARWRCPQPHQQQLFSAGPDARVTSDSKPHSPALYIRGLQWKLRPVFLSKVGREHQAMRMMRVSAPSLEEDTVGEWDPKCCPGVRRCSQSANNVTQASWNLLVQQILRWKRLRDSPGISMGHPGDVRCRASCRPTHRAPQPHIQPLSSLPRSPCVPGPCSRGRGRARAALPPACKSRSISPSQIPSSWGKGGSRMYVEGFPKGEARRRGDNASREET